MGLSLSRDSDAPVVLALGDERATDLQLAGAKAANLAIALRAGLPVYPGFVVTTLGTSRLDDPDAARAQRPSGPLHEAWRHLSEDGRRPLAVRSSSVVEDSTTSSMAGRFVSILDVVGWEQFAAAVDEVVASAASTEIADAPMAVLVQPMGDARVGGVLFGLDPLTGDRRRLRASVTDGLPEEIVSGRVTGSQLVLGRRGRLRSVSGPVPVALHSRHRRRLARLARRTERLFGGPQDLEWLIDRDGVVRLLQSRPITAAALPPQGSHPLGPGPVAETFPNALHPLERDLWEPPLEDGIREALRISGAVSRRALAERFVVDIGGRVAVDLEALGVVDPPSSLLHHLDPRPPYRHLRAAWRIGRLARALPSIVHDLVAEVDEHLAAVPSLDQLGDLQLLGILDNGAQTLGALHAHEVLSGFFLDERTSSTTGAAVALGALSRGRADGWSDDEIVERLPVVLALLPPEIAGDRHLPATPLPHPTPTGDGDDPMAVAREVLRMRVRWTHELTARVAEELGTRAASRALLRAARDVRDLSLVQMRELVVALNAGVVHTDAEAEPPPLPASFRLAADGSIVPDLAAGDGPLGVSPGRAVGEVTHDPADAAGKVLVVPSLDPALAGVLGSVAALVSETGSPLSHLAILAREQRVPVVVGVAAGSSDLWPGARVLVDGSTATVEVQAAAPAAPQPAHDEVGPASPRRRGEPDEQEVG
jgi:pyruvate,water dikinase